MSDPLETAATPTTIAGLSEVPESEGIPNGEHTFTIKSAKEVTKTPKDGGAEYQALQLLLIAEDVQDVDPVFDTVSLDLGSEYFRDNMRKIKRIYHAAGVPISGDELVFSDLVGKAVRVTTRSKLVNGAPQVNINWPKAV